jgi:hypothetical protein
LILSLFNGIISIAEAVKMVMNSDKVMIWKEVIITYLKVLSRHPPEDTEECLEK